MVSKFDLLMREFYALSDEFDKSLGILKERLGKFRKENTHFAARLDALKNDSIRALNRSPFLLGRNDIS